MGEWETEDEIILNEISLIQLNQIEKFYWAIKMIWSNELINNDNTVEWNDCTWSNKFVCICIFLRELVLNYT